MTPIEDETLSSRRFCGFICLFVGDGSLAESYHLVTSRPYRFSSQIRLWAQNEAKGTSEKLDREGSLK